MVKLTISIETDMSMDEALAITQNLSGMDVVPTTVQTQPVAVTHQPAVPTTQDIAPVVNDPTPATDTEYGGDLDANGTPWIDGIHATTKNQTKAGVWSRRRGVSVKDAADAEAAARAKLAGAPTAATPVAGLPGSAPAAEPEPTVEDVAPVSMDELANIYTQVNAAGLITPAEVMELYKKHGCEVPNDIATNETARAKVGAELRAIYAAYQAPAAGGLPGA